jgi:hypothetical protein
VTSPNLFTNSATAISYTAVNANPEGSVQTEGQALYQQASNSSQPDVVVKRQFEQQNQDQKTQLANEFIESAGREGIYHLASTPDGQHALAVVYNHAGSEGRGFMREAHEEQGHTAIDYTQKDSDGASIGTKMQEGIVAQNGAHLGQTNQVVQATQDPQTTPAAQATPELAHATQPAPEPAQAVQTTPVSGNGGKQTYSATLNSSGQADKSAIGLVAGTTIAVAPKAESSLGVAELVKSGIKLLPEMAARLAEAAVMMLIPGEIGQDPTTYQLDGRDELRVKYDEDMLSGVIEQQVDGAWESTGQVVTPEYKNDDFFGGIVDLLLRMIFRMHQPPIRYAHLQMHRAPFLHYRTERGKWQIRVGDFRRMKERV